MLCLYLQLTSGGGTGGSWWTGLTRVCCGVNEQLVSRDTGQKRNPQTVLSFVFALHSSPSTKLRWSPTSSFQLPPTQASDQTTHPTPLPFCMLCVFHLVNRSSASISFSIPSHLVLATELLSVHEGLPCQRARVRGRCPVPCLAKSSATASFVPLVLKRACTCFGK